MSSESSRISDKDYQTVVKILKQITKPDGVNISKAESDQLCFRCKVPMCSIDLAENETYYECLGCGHIDTKL